MKQLLVHQQTSPSTRTLLLGIWRHLTHRRRMQLRSLLLVMLLSGLAELVSLGAVLPFLALLSDPRRLWQQPFVQSLAMRVGFTSESQLVLPVSLLFAFAAVMAAFIRLSNLWLNVRLAAAVGSDLSCEAYRRTLYQPYEVHLQRNSSEVIKRVTNQIVETVAALNSLLQMITSAVVALGLLTGLVIIDAPVAFGAVALFGTAYGLLAITARRQLRSNSHKISKASSQQLKVLQEGLGAIRDVLLDGSQSAYLQGYRKADRPQRQLRAKNVFLATFPRYALEALGIVGIAFLGGVLVSQRGNGVEVIPLLGALALGAQRLLPVLQQFYSGWAALKGYNAAMQGVLEMLNQALPLQIDGVKALHICKSVVFNDVHYRYKENQPKVLQGLNLEIKRGERIALIGSTGSGKSTLVDLLMGLLIPTSGMLVVDGVDLHDPAHPERILAWRASIAHVPQSIYLADRSISENIAFGVPPHEIDMVRVKQAAEQAQIANFIEASREGYGSFVGEQGIRLSGGQRQRIGIARALYKKANILVLDEATSALDTSTEKTVMDAINAFSQSLTVIMIAHRLSTVENCDRVIRIDQGSITADGPPSLVLAA